MAFLVLMVNLYLSIKHIRKIRKGSAFSLLLILLFLTTEIHSQELSFGFTAGLNMSTISSAKDNGGLKIGYDLGGIAKYPINNKSNICANILFSTQGQQYSDIIDNENEYMKIYHSTSLYYINIPILYQYYFNNIIGIEAGPSLGLCLGGKDKSRIGNENWDIKKFSKGTYNTFDLGITLGIYTKDLGQSAFNNIFIGFRYTFGLINIEKEVGRNTNRCASISIGYIIEQPLKKH